MTTTNGHTEYVIFSDTSCGVDDVLSKKYDICLMSVPIRVNGNDYYPYAEQKPFDWGNFLGDLKETDRVYTWKLTSEDYKRYFRPLLEQGKDIVYIHFSGFGTNTFEVDLPSAIEELKKEFPKREIFAFDCKSVAQGALPIILRAALMRLENATMPQIKNYLETNVGKRVAYFIPENLSYLGKYGKVSGVAAFLGNSFKIRPILEAGTDGKMMVVAKFIGQDLALSKKLLQRMKKEGFPVDREIDVGYVDSRERGENFITSFSLMAKRMGEKPFKYTLTRINPLHCGIIGPGAIGLAYALKKIV